MKTRTHLQLLTTLALALTMNACTTPKPLRGGHAITTPTPTGGVGQSIVQSDNPSAPSRQTQETIKTRTYSLPATCRLPSAISETCPVVPPSRPAVARSTPNCQLPSPISREAVLVTDREESRATTELGAAQKDTARDLAAKLSSLKGIVWVGVALFIFGLASIFWPPLKLIIGSLTTSAAITLGGLALIVLPTLIVGNELLILGGVTLVLSAWFLAHRHGHLRGLVDANHNGIDDRLERPAPNSQLPTPN